MAAGLEVDRPAVCIACSQRQMTGLVILSRFLCHACEKVLLSEPVGSKSYMKMAEGIKNIWQEVEKPFDSQGEHEK